MFLLATTTLMTVPNDETHYNGAKFSDKIQAKQSEKKRQKKMNVSLMKLNTGMTLMIGKLCFE